MNATDFFDPRPAAAAARLALTVDVMRDLSRARDPQAMYAVYARRMGEIFPTDRQISLSRRGLPAPGVRVTRFNLWPAEVNPWAEPGRLPVLPNGLLADLIAAGEPTIMNRLAVPPGDPAAPYLAGQGSLMAIPLYDGGESVNMIVVTRAAPDAFTADRLPEIVWMSNLFGRATQAALATQQLHAAHDLAQHELRQVAKLQRALLPTELPRVSTLDMGVYSRSTATAGGDYYDVFRLPRNRVGLLVADVCGHGAPAAMLLAVVHSLVKTYTGPPSPPGLLLTYVNNHLTETYTRAFGTFVTAVYAIYDPDRGTLTWANAGHPPPRLTRLADNSRHALDRRRAVPLGIVDGTAYPSEEVILSPGDQVVLHTDGVTDAKNRADESFGPARFDAALGDCPIGAKGIIKRVLDSLEKHAGGVPFADDCTVIAMKFVRSKKKAGEVSGEFKAVPAQDLDG